MATAIKQDDPAAQMHDVLAKQRADFTASMPEPVSARIDRMDRAIALLVDHADDFAKAVSEDFGHRSEEQTLMTDIVPSISALKHAKKHINSWSRGERRKPTFPLGLLGAKAEVKYQPKGVVGVVAPWNFPVGMVMVPMAGILAAGNRAMVKPSEFTERVSELFVEIVPKYFAETEMAVFTGGPEVGMAFSGLPFDHMIFTGATSIGKHIMRAASENLVPVTLELGGKSPTIIGRSADKKKAAERVALGKMMNAGQICLAPDYLYVAEEQEDEMIGAVSQSVSAMYPTLLTNDDYTSVVNGRNHDRLQGYLDDAKEKGAELIEVNPGDEDFSSSNGHKMPLTILRNVNDDMKVMQEEIFGPILPVKTYNTIDEAIDYVNENDRPLGLYYFGSDSGEEERVLGKTISGGVTVNDVIFHNAMEDLPFGGIGPSGMGHYHGYDGFKEFSHMRAVYKQASMDVAGMAGFKPPYGKKTWATIKRELKK
ncbi:coniferyl aldehyde dehydrogenase [Alterisphingorhabdus coralli]|uniref:Aldehyde dehydrogenase n=1 Tax=Alterisphingorhabdus coralli TaxID=3071408 RepID=A0AA97F974_9SPHN|nr:coniferyl aldehyde dehydrogenase [Parasphingorhabdus sp. SCSIO 66989]WOE76288.1 coniferyl aldehyde dehydrogenase [Parasphingorhabdus sp. SCSIO 66989]